MIELHRILIGFFFSSWSLLNRIGDEWSIEAAQLVMELTQARALQAQVVGYTEFGIPEIYLYITLGPNVSIA